MRIGVHDSAWCRIDRRGQIDEVQTIVGTESDIGDDKVKRDGHQSCAGRFKIRKVLDRGK